MNESVSLISVLITIGLAIGGIGVTVIGFFMKGLVTEVKHIPSLIHRIETVSRDVQLASAFTVLNRPGVPTNIKIQ